VLDLDYAEDSAADADANFILTEGGGIVEIQATAEKATFDDAAFGALLALARAGTAQLFASQKAIIGG
jgi:ribonuclease PH